MRSRDPLVVFWVAALAAVVFLGFAWSTWKAASPIAAVVAVPATIAFAVATLVAGRVLIVVTRAARNQRRAATALSMIQTQAERGAADLPRDDAENASPESAVATPRSSAGEPIYLGPRNLLTRRPEIQSGLRQISGSASDRHRKPWGGRAAGRHLRQRPGPWNATA